MPEKKLSLGVFVCIFNKDFSKILLIKRNAEKRKKYGKDWGNIGGIIEFRETSKQACIREAQEEIGLTLKENELKLIKVKEMPNYSEIYHATQFIYAISISEDAKITINHESEDFKWFNLDNLPESMLDKKEDILDILRVMKKG